jgi:hypothetical protein
MEQEVQFDKPEQLEKIQEGLLPDETVYAVFDMKGGGTGFIGITDKRVMIQDSAFLTKESDRLRAVRQHSCPRSLGGHRDAGWARFLRRQQADTEYQRGSLRARVQGSG